MSKIKYLFFILFFLFILAGELTNISYWKSPDVKLSDNFIALSYSMSQPWQHTAFEANFNLRDENIIKPVTKVLAYTGPFIGIILNLLICYFFGILLEYLFLQKKYWQGSVLIISFLGLFLEAIYQIIKYFWVSFVVAKIY
jgi:hypothetical protein